MPLSTWQFEQIMRSYDQTRQRNHALHLKRQDEIYQTIPEIKNIDDTIAERSIQAGKALLFHKDDQVLKDLKIENLELSMKKVELLVSNGYEPDYLNPIYDCSLCKDTGYVNGEKCRCLKQSIVRQAYQQSNIEKKLQEENFQTFSYEYYDNKVSQH